MSDVGSPLAVLGICVAHKPTSVVKEGRIGLK
jgi:hypothetical protein